ncbi:ABC transporter permease [Saliphagus infecundisoli]|uniref:ABC transporter permease n=1 Tax=Saliphagus infecundisoli TaxID=1849069 RepID=A0ABD5QBA0_9EURY|nr:ABC transporter permease [Saliphagus infecundisoli]
MNVRWVGKRILQGMFTAYLVITFTFVLIRQMPGGPVEYLKAQLITSQGSLTEQERQRLNQLAETYININPDKPVWQQYVEYMISIVQGDLGESIWYNQPVAELIGEAMPWTLLVTASSILLSFVIGITIGAWMAYNEGNRIDIGLSSFATFLTSIPYYVIGVLSVYILGYQLGWFPTSGYTSGEIEASLSIAYISDVLYHAALPIISFTIPAAFGQSLSMRGNSVRILGEDYLRVASLRGLSNTRIALHYVGRNAILPMYTSLLLAIGTVFGGAVILEEIFTYRGAGLLLLKAINNRDYPLMMGMFLIITIGVICGMIIADLTYGKLDPRIDSGEGSR